MCITFSISLNTSKLSNSLRISFFLAFLFKFFGQILVCPNWYYVRQLSVKQLLLIVLYKCPEERTLCTEPLESGEINAASRSVGSQGTATQGKGWQLSGNEDFEQFQLHLLFTWCLRCWLARSCRALDIHEYCVAGVRGRGIGQLKCRKSHCFHQDSAFFFLNEHCRFLQAFT